MNVKSIKRAIAHAIAEVVVRPTDEVARMLEYPPNPALGDLALPCFQFAREMRKNPVQIAQDLADRVRQVDGVENAQAEKGFLNIRLARAPFAERVVGQAITSVHDLFSQERGRGRTAVIDYSSPNIAKPFGVGHLRSTIIGHALKRMMREDGWKVEGVNHLGDWGTQFGKVIAAYLKWGSEDEVRRDPVKELFRLYVRFHQEAESSPELEDEGRLWFKKLEDGDPEATRLWRWFIDESLRAFKQVYDLLGVEFEHYIGESFYNDKMDAIVQELRAKGLLMEDQGAEVVDLSAYDMPPCIIVKSDGTSIYATRDLAAADYRHHAFGADTLLYVVGAEQKLHFEQVFKVLELMGRDYAKNCVHVQFGLMKFNGQRLSTRRGHVVYLEDVLQKAIEEARAIIDEKNPGLEDKEAIARQVGVGAVIFNDLKTYRVHEVDFRYEDVLNFDGETGPYVQYTHARASSVLRKAEADQVAWDPSYAPDDAEWALIFLLAQANESLERAVDTYDPSVIARYALQLCHAFNRFYHDHPILQADEPARRSRLALTRAVRDALAKSLYLLGIEAPEEM
ncbi:MAG: arginine--tRNA ligase [Alicyclobacillus mali]|uniref:arginine--tRNA ligase n=1 Tax=Alicyclobacillus mali (ex Roth et al. 2021) TaxID=1123961 RepID=UPI0023F23E5B|nr:arginine--tRNA ligase [Alicyclobacillus mali (ex Roth et al. 2021)]MCL6488651.1 arginine--tRNA ligase [Alicyclobacillus mali (ex Roth et al. 2021)]